MAITTAMCTSFKRDILSGLHCLNATTTFTATGTSTVTWTSVSSLVGLAVGMKLSGTNIAADTVIARILSATSIEVSKASTGALSGSITATADVIKIALVKTSMTGNYDASTDVYADLTGNSDEVANGSGYTTGGATLTNVSPTISGTTAFVDFADPSWTSASFSTTGCVIYNTTQRGPLVNPTLSVHDFGGTQTVASGTFTIVMPTADASNAILRIA